MAYEYISALSLGEDEAPASPVTNGGLVDSGDPLMQTYQTNGGTVRVHWGGIALAGLAAWFFWWLFKEFMPRMDAAARREQGL